MTLLRIIALVAAAYRPQAPAYSMSCYQAAVVGMMGATMTVCTVAWTPGQRLLRSSP